MDGIRLERERERESERERYAKNVKIVNFYPLLKCLTQENLIYSLFIA